MRKRREVFYPWRQGWAGHWIWIVLGDHRRVVDGTWRESYESAQARADALNAEAINGESH